MQYIAVQCSAVQSNIMLYSDVQVCSAVQLHSAGLGGSVHCSTALALLWDLVWIVLCSLLYLAFCTTDLIMWSLLG